MNFGHKLMEELIIEYSKRTLRQSYYWNVCVKGLISNMIKDSIALSKKIFGIELKETKICRSNLNSAESTPTNGQLAHQAGFYFFQKIMKK